MTIGRLQMPIYVRSMNLVCVMNFNHCPWYSPELRPCRRRCSSVWWSSVLTFTLDKVRSCQVSSCKAFASVSWLIPQKWYGPYHMVAFGTWLGMKLAKQFPYLCPPNPHTHPILDHYKLHCSKLENCHYRESYALMLDLFWMHKYFIEYYFLLCLIIKLDSKMHPKSFLNPRLQFLQAYWSIYFIFGSRHNIPNRSMTQYISKNGKFKLIIYLHA